MKRPIFLIIALGLALLFPKESGAQAPFPGAEGASSEGAAETTEATSAEEPSEEAKQEASARFQRGLAFYGEGDYALALIEFERAYQLVPDFRVLYNIGQVSIQLSHPSEALRALERYLEEGRATLTAERTQTVESDLAMLRARTAHLLVEGTQGAEVLVDEESQGLLPLDKALLIDAGRHQVVVKKEGFHPFTQRITLAGAEELRIAAQLEQKELSKPIPVTSKPDPLGAEVLDARRHQSATSYPSYALVSWVSAGVLGGGAVFSAVMGMSAKSRLNELKSHPDPSESDLAKESSAAGSWFLAADILAVSSLLAAGAGLYFSLSGTDTGPRLQAQAGLWGRSPDGRAMQRDSYLALEPRLGGATLVGRF